MDAGRDPATGKRRQQWHTVKGTKREAEKRLAELVNQVDNGQYSQPTKLTFGSFMGRWLQDYAWPNLSPETAQAYDIMAQKHLMPALGNIPLQQLTPSHIQTYYTDKLTFGRRDGKGGLSPRTVRHHHRLIHVALESAVKLQLVHRNVSDAVTAPKYRNKEIQTFNEEGMLAFLESVKVTEYYPMFYTALFTGVRRSELLALRWSDIDLDLGYISINRSIHHLEDKSFVFQPPKTAKSRRQVPLSPSTSIVLRQHRDNQRAAKLLLGNPVTESSLVFCQLDGSPLLPRSVSQAWTRLVRQAGFPGIRLHDARHTHATLMLEQGVNWKIISERLGHGSVAMTLDLYAHASPGLQKAAAEGFDKVLDKQRDVGEINRTSSAQT
ncbi:MAG: tyrosine-type recombinase/integrase [Chloroflexota bacterium]|nr:tyrosine-type recombinase/integrase [Chloroflexota bacterium]